MTTQGSTVTYTRLTESVSTGVIDFEEIDGAYTFYCKSWRDSNGSRYFVHDTYETDEYLVSKRSGVDTQIYSTYVVDAPFSREATLCVSHDESKLYLLYLDSAVALRFVILDSTTLALISEVVLYSPVDFEAPIRMMQDKDSNLWWLGNSHKMHRMNDVGGDIYTVDLNSTEISIPYQTFCLDERNKAAYVMPLSTDGSYGLGIKRITYDSGFNVSTYYTKENLNHLPLDSFFQDGAIYTLVEDRTDRNTKLVKVPIVFFNDKTKWVVKDIGTEYGIDEFVQIFSTKGNKYGYFFQDDFTKGTWRFDKSDLSCMLLVSNDGNLEWNMTGTRLQRTPRSGDYNCDPGWLYRVFNKEIQSS